MANETKTVETVVSFIPGTYGAVAQAFMAIFDFAHSFGKTDPLDYAVARLQRQIDALVAELGKVNDRLNRHARRIARIENERHVDKLLDLNREAARLALRIAQRPTDAKERALIGFDARVLADRFLLEPDVWQWTDLEVTRHFDDYGQFAREEVWPLEPDFKTHLALPSYTAALLLLLAAIDLDTMGEPSAVRQRYGDALERHLTAVTSRPGWTDLADPPETLAEMIRARITCRPLAVNKYAAAGECVFGIVCENVMERHTAVVRDVTLMMADRGPTVLCSAPPDVGRADEEEIEGEKGVTLLTQLGQLMRQVLTQGSLREPFIGRFALAPTLPLALLYGIGHDGSVDWYRQAPGDGANAVSGWLTRQGTRHGWEDYTRIFPAGGNCFYALRSDGELHWFAHDDFNDGGPAWTGWKRVGTGWNNFLSITPGGDGVLYAVQPDGKLLWYRHDGLTSGGDVETWRGGVPVHAGFHEYQRLFSVNEGVLYAVQPDGRLLWFHHKGFKDGTPRWDGPRDVGNGWQNFRDVFGTDEGVVYAQQADGTLLRYVHLTWKTGGDVRTWRPPVPVSFGVGGYKQMVTLMSRAVHIH